MRRITLFMSVSLDGFIEGPGRDIGWHQVDEELHDHLNDELAAFGGFISGRRTFELMAGVWPTADTDPASSPAMVRFAGIWRDKPKIVYSRTLERAGWNTTVLPEVDPGQVGALRAEPGGDLALSGAELAAEFIGRGLIDAYRIYVHPVLVGGGTPLFPAADSIRLLRLERTRTFGNGVVMLHYGH